MVALLLMPSTGDVEGLLTGLRFDGLQWLWPLLVPPLAAAVAYVTTTAAARRVLGGLA